MDEGEYRALAALERLFARARHVEVNAVSDEIELRSGSSSWHLHPTWVGEGFPQDIKLALSRAKEPADTVEVLVARRMSTGSRALLADLRVNWLDLDGNSDIQEDGLYVRTGKVERTSPPPPTFKWTRSSGAVAETLLDDRIRVAANGTRSSTAQELKRVQAISEIAGWSQAQVGKVLQQFDSEGYTEKIGSQRGATALRVLRAPHRLLSDWAGWYRKLHVESIGFTGEPQDPMEYVTLAERVLGIGRVIVSGWPALEGYAPYMTATPSTLLYVDADVDLDTVRERFVNELELRPVQAGARVTVMIAEPHVTRLARGSGSSIRAVSPVRLYGDLLRAGIRGEDAANHLREVSIGF